MRLLVNLPFRELFKLAPELGVGHLRNQAVGVERNLEIAGRVGLPILKQALRQRTGDHCVIFADRFIVQRLFGEESIQSRRELADASGGLALLMLLDRRDHQPDGNFHPILLFAAHLELDGFERLHFGFQLGRGG